MAAKQEPKVIIIPAIKLQSFDLHLVGDSPLICHKWTEKAKMMLIDKQVGKASKAKGIRRPCVEYASSLYWMSEEPDFEGMTDEEVMAAVDNGTFGFPTLAFKAAAIDGAFQQKIIPNKTSARGAFHVIGELCELHGKPEMFEAVTRIGMGTAFLAYRALFPAWETTLRIQFNTAVISMEQIANLFNVGGFSVGVGDWRVQKDGRNGMFHVG